jgi:uncharacterized protein
VPDLPSEIWALAVAITLSGGFVKGAVGFAMPLIMVSGLTTIMEPRLAVAAIILPIVISNVFQTFRTGIEPALEALRGNWRFVLSGLRRHRRSSRSSVPRIDPQVFYLLLGVPVVLISVIQLLGLRFTIPPRHRGWAEWAAGIVSGVLGGLAGTWGPTTVLYLLAVEMPKARQMVVQGVIYGAGSVTLLFAHLASGVLEPRHGADVGAPDPARALGMWLGFRLQDRLDQRLFARAVLIVLAVSGLNLVWKGLSG